METYQHPKYSLGFPRVALASLPLMLTAILTFIYTLPLYTHGTLYALKSGFSYPQIMRESSCYVWLCTIRSSAVIPLHRPENAVGVSVLRLRGIWVLPRCGYYKQGCCEDKDDRIRYASRRGLRGRRVCRASPWKGTSRGCTILHPQEPRERVPVAPRPHQHLLLSDFPILTAPEAARRTFPS